MGVTATTVHNHIVYVDTDYPHRWVGVVGPKVTKFEFDAITYSADMFTVTVIGGDTIAQVDGAFGGNVVLTPDDAEEDGVQVQLLGEAFYLSGQYPAYFGCRFMAADVDQTDILVGLCIQDTTAIAAVSDGAYFRTADESAVLNFVLEQDSVETSNAAATMTDAAWIIAEFYYDGVTNITAYIDGVQVAQVALTDANMPDDEYLSPILAMLAGEADVANTVTVDWARAYQIRE